MKIAIHHIKGSFSDRWIEYCELKGLYYRLVNCYSNSIISELEDIDILLWHWSHMDEKNRFLARQLIKSLESKGLTVFPNSYTSWHFDDKIGQKYLLEAIQAPICESFVFYDKSEAIDWVNSTRFPKVFKLRGGAGAVNVQLVKSKKKAIKLISKMFSSGIKPYSRFTILNFRIKNFKVKKDVASFIGIIKGILRMFLKNEKETQMSIEKGYVYFQEYLSNNSYDTRIIIIGEKSFGFRRMVRKNDFRASGSGLIDYSHTNIDTKMVRISFEFAKKLKMQCCAFDFVYDKKMNPKILEISYGFAPYLYDKCEGIWDSDLQWKNETVNPQFFMIEEVIKEYERKT